MCGLPRNQWQTFVPGVCCCDNWIWSTSSSAWQQLQRKHFGMSPKVNFHQHPHQNYIWFWWIFGKCTRVPWGCVVVMTLACGLRCTFCWKPGGMQGWAFTSNGCTTMDPNYLSPFGLMYFTCEATWDLLVNLPLSLKRYKKRDKKVMDNSMSFQAIMTLNSTL